MTDWHVPFHSTAVVNRDTLGLNKYQQFESAMPDNLGLKEEL